MKLGLLTLTFLLCVAHARADVVCRPQAPAVTNFGEHRYLDRHVSSAESHTAIDLSTPGKVVRYVRLRLRTSDLRGDWKIVVRDQNLTPLEVLDKDSVFDVSGSIWTERLPTAWVDLTLSTTSNMKIDVVAADVMPASTAQPYYSTKAEKPDWMYLYVGDMATVPAVDRYLGDSVGMLTSFPADGSNELSTWCCSGSIIADHPSILFMTNFHCGGVHGQPADKFWTADICSNTIVDMSWDGKSSGSDYACSKVVRTSEELDVAVIELLPIGRRRAPATPVSLRANPVAAGEQLRLVHHPECLPKRISASCSVSKPVGAVSSGKEDFGHQCDSEGGSSGGPLFDDAGQLVGIQHLGFGWTTGPARVCDGLNKAVSSVALRDFLIDLRLEGGGWTPEAR